MSDCSIKLVADHNVDTGKIDIRGIEDGCESMSLAVHNFADYQALFVDEFHEMCSQTRIDISGYYKKKVALFGHANDVVVVAQSSGVEVIGEAESPMAHDAPRKGVDNVHENESGELKPPPGMQRTLDEQRPVTDGFVSMIFDKYNEYDVLNSGSSSDFHLDTEDDYAPGIYNFELVLSNTGSKSPDEIYNMLIQDIAASGIIPSDWKFLSVKVPEYVFDEGKMGIKFVIQYQTFTALK